MSTPTRARLTPTELLILGLFFSSGASALIYEVVWSRKLTYVFGGSAFAIATVLAAYMAGLALGSAWIGRRIDRRGHPMMVYGLLEGSIAAWALLLPLFLGLLDHVYAALYRSLDLGFYPLSLIRFLFSFLLLLVPTTMMGGTLPVLGKYLLRGSGFLGRRAALLYGINTLGAVAGVALGGFVLLPAAGLTGGTAAAVAINVAVATVAILSARRIPWKPSPGAPDAAAAAGEGSGRERVLRRLVLVVYAASGFAALAYEVVWTKVLSLTLGTTTYAFTSMLATFLLGLALGSFLFGWLADRVRRPLLLLAPVQIGIAVLALLTIPRLEALPQLYVDAFPRLGNSWLSVEYYRFWLAASTMFLPTLLMGGTFPLVTRVYADRAHVGRSLGTLYAANTVGAILGSFLTGFVLIPLIGRQTSILVATLVNLVPALALLAALGIRNLSRASRLLAAASLLALLPAGWLGVRRWDPRILASGAYYYAPQMGEAESIGDYLADLNLLYYREATEATISVWQTAHVTSLRINGKIDASSHGDMITQKLVSHVPALYHRSGQEDCAVVGLASGISVGALLTHPVRSVETVELIGGLDEAARFFDDYNGRCLDDPRHRLIVNDGRNHLRLTDRRYDIIVSQPTNPWIAGVGALFTREYFRLTRERLKPGGIACQWVQIYHMRDDDLRAVLATFLDEFPHTHLWEASTGDLILIGSDEALRLDRAALERMTTGPAGRDFESLEIDPLPNLLAYFVTDREGIERYVGGVGRRVTDDNLYLEYAMPRHLFDRTGLTDAAAFEPVAKSPEVLFPPADLDSAFTADLRGCDEAQRLAVRTFLGKPLPPGLATPADAYRRVLEASPRNVVARERLASQWNEEGIRALTEGRGEAARARFEEAIRVGIRAERSLAWNNIGYLHFQAGALDSAEACWRRSHREEPRSPVVNFNLGLLAARRGDTDGAIEAYRLALRYDPRNAGILNNCAYQLARAGKDLTEAEAMARRAVALDPIPDHLDTHGVLLARLGSRDEAEAAFRRALEGNAGLESARVHLADLLLRAGRREEAERELRRVLDSGADPDVMEEARAVRRALDAGTPPSRENP